MANRWKNTSRGVHFPGFPLWPLKGQFSVAGTHLHAKLCTWQPHHSASGCSHTGSGVRERQDSHCLHGKHRDSLSTTCVLLETNSICSQTLNTLWGPGIMQDLTQSMALIYLPKPRLTNQILLPFLLVTYIHASFLDRAETELYFQPFHTSNIKEK